MKFGLMFSNIGPFGRPQGLTHLAQTAERVGIESLWTVEHVAVPVGYQSRYPYSPDGKMPGPEKSPIPDPLVWLSYAAAVTERIRLATGILILPQRHPIYTAKEVATLDQLSDGRVTLGIGIGWLEEEFRSLGVPFKQRAGRTEECVAAMRQLWSDETKPFKGEYYHWDAIESNPKPVQPGGVPIVVGGHVDASARRAARIGNGFFPGKGDLDRLEELIGIMSDECARVGRSPDEIEVTTGGPIQSRDDVKRYEDIGVSRLILAPPGFEPDALEKGLEDIGDRLIA